MGVAASNGGILTEHSRWQAEAGRLTHRGGTDGRLWHVSRSRVSRYRSVYIPGSTRLKRRSRLSVIATVERRFLLRVR